MTIKMGILMDPIQNINITKDTSFALLLEAQQRGWKNYYFEAKDIWLQEGQVMGNLATVDRDA